MSPLHRMKMSGRTSESSFVYTTSFLRTDGAFVSQLKMVSTSQRGEKKIPQEQTQQISICKHCHGYLLNLCKTLKVMIESKVLDVCVHTHTHTLIRTSFGQIRCSGRRFTCLFEGILSFENHSGFADLNVNVVLDLYGLHVSLTVSGHSNLYNINPIYL